MRNALIFAGLALSAWQCSAAVAVDSVGPSSSGTAVSNSFSLSWSHTVTSSGSNAVLVVGVAVGNNNDTGLSLAVTYNSVAMASAGLVHANNASAGFVQLFCLAAPAAGTHTVAVTLSGGTADLIGGSISFTGANQSSPCVNVATAAGMGPSPAVTVSSVSGDMVVDIVGTGAGVTASNQTLAWINNFNSGTGDSSAAQSLAAGAPTVTMAHSVTSDYWGIIGVDIAAASSSSTGNPCDLNKDGVVNSTDVSLAVNMAVGTQTCSASLEGPNTCTVITVQRVINASEGQACVTYSTHATTLSWSASTSSNVSYYNIYRGTASGGPYTNVGSTTPSSGVTTYKDAAVQAGQTYYYVATTVDISGNESSFSNQTSTTIPIP